ncbi:hypothetical protein CLV63_101353 [Murinocardiopsis flavida]|uniref:Glycerophosphoryl diester phosphodiesterase family protein n=1 Tax=Murinocardiopsis flavida TaxID=645275 RepID=A0A2P8DUL4_9ACTN|nr:hypothetical protein [Murinocardiopsis flavida]PSL00874.1 hypothetical protein CLV63_101353 [Murinocardiopsis flavida]
MTAEPGGDEIAANGRRPGGGDGWRPLADTFALVGRLRRPLYGFSFAVSALAAGAVGAIAALGFALAWDAFGTLREIVARNKAAEDPPFSATGETEPAFGLTAVLVVVLLLLLLSLVLALQYSAHAVAVRTALDGRGPPGAGGLWRGIRPYLARVLGIQLLMVLGVAITLVAGVDLFEALARDLLPGITRPRSPFTGFSPLDWVAGLGLPLITACVGPFVFIRLSLAGAAVVFEDSTAGDALRRSWTLTRGSPARVFRAWLPITAAVALAAALLWYAATPLARPAGAAMMWLSGGNVHTAGTLAQHIPAAAAACVLPVVVMPPVCVLLCVLYTGLAAREGERSRPTP